MRRHSARALVIALLSVLAVVHAGKADAPAIRLETPSSSSPVPGAYPTVNCLIRLRVTCTRPGVVLDTVGIDTAPIGAFQLSLMPDGRVDFRIYDPGKQSPVRDASGWHVFTSRAAVALGVATNVSVEVTPTRVKLFVGGKLDRDVEVSLRLSGRPLYVGDYPGDDHWGSGYNIHPAMVGTVAIRYIGDRASAPVVAGTPAPSETPRVDSEPTESVTRTIDGGGGVIALRDGSGVEIPPGAVRGPTSVTVRSLRQVELCPSRSDREQIILDCSASVSRFAVPVRVRFPLPEDSKARLDGLQAGYVDERRGLKVELPYTVTGSGPTRFLVIQTPHFTSFFMDRMKNLFVSPPSARTIPNVPYYSQGSSTYCWAACTQMVCEAVRSGDTPGEIWDVIGRMKVAPGGLTSVTAAFSSTWRGIIRGRTGVSPDIHYWQANPVRLRKYIYEQIGFYGQPVLYSSSSLDHAVVIVGYDSAPADPVFVINDPALTGTQGLAYRRVPVSRLFLSNDNAGSNAVVTVVVPADVVTSRPAVRVSFATQRLTARVGRTPYFWTWDHQRIPGYSMKVDVLSTTGGSSDVVPGIVTALDAHSLIEITNATATDQTVGCRYVLASGKSELVRERKAVVVPAYGMAVVPVDVIDFKALRAKGEMGPEYTFWARLMQGDAVIDTASTEFSEGLLRIGRPIGLTEKGVTRFEYTFKVDARGIPDDATYRWTVDGRDGGTGPTLLHTFDRAGSYPLTLKATWRGGEATARTVMVIAADVSEEKAEVAFFVFRYFKNRMGKSRQACNQYSIQILRDNKVVDGGTSIARNGDYSITLPVGTGYSYRVGYRYPDPHPDSGSRSGSFSVVKGTINSVQVETPPYESGP